MTGSGNHHARLILGRYAMPKYLFFFEKGESVRWLGHLDILRAFERAIRRAELPIAFSQGFNPRIRINFASALSTGITGSAEPGVLDLVDAVECAELASRLNTSLPPGIRVGDLKEIPESGTRDLLNAFNYAQYDFVCTAAHDYSNDKAEDAACSLMAQDEILIVREREGRSRSINIRPMISKIKFNGRTPETGRLCWTAIVSIGESGNVKPVDLVAALSEYLPELNLRRAHRVRLLEGGLVAKGDYC